jgi:hypothetical protein
MYLMITPMPVVQVNPQPLPPGALVRFDTQPVLTDLVPPGPATVTDVPIHLWGQFSESGQTGPAPETGTNEQLPGPVAQWSLEVTYDLEGRARETLAPPGPQTIGPSPQQTTSGSLDFRYALWGRIETVFTVTDDSGGVQVTLSTGTTGADLPMTKGHITGAIEPAGADGAQVIDFSSHTTTSVPSDGYTLRKLPGRTKYEPLNLERGVVRDVSLSGWHQTLVSGTATKSSAVTAIDAGFSGTDQIDEDVALIPIDPATVPPGTFQYHIAGTVHAAGSVNETLTPPDPQGQVFVSGSTRSQDTTIGTITPSDPSVSPPQTQPLNEESEGTGSFQPVAIGPN